MSRKIPHPREYRGIWSSRCIENKGFADFGEFTTVVLHH